MNQYSDLELLNLIKKASSKDYHQEDHHQSPQDNPESTFEEELPSGVWRTNLFLEGE